MQEAGDAAALIVSEEAAPDIELAAMRSELHAVEESAVMPVPFALICAAGKTATAKHADKLRKLIKAAQDEMLEGSPALAPVDSTRFLCVVVALAHRRVRTPLCKYCPVRDVDCVVISLLLLCS